MRSPNHPNKSAPKIKTYPAFDKHLARGPEGEAVIANDPEGVLRYLYADGSRDERSTVNVHNSVIEVAGCVAVGNVITLEAPNHDSANESRAPLAAVA